MTGAVAPPTIVSATSTTAAVRCVPGRLADALAGPTGQLRRIANPTPRDEAARRIVRVALGCGKDATVPPDEMGLPPAGAGS
jgi:hypothetical protein